MITVEKQEEVLKMMANEAIAAVATAKLIAREQNDEQLEALVESFNQHVAGLPFLLTMLRPASEEK